MDFSQGTRYIFGGHTYMCYMPDVFKRLSNWDSCLIRAEDWDSYMSAVEAHDFGSIDPYVARGLIADGGHLWRHGKAIGNYDDLISGDN